MIAGIPKLLVVCCSVLLAGAYIVHQQQKAAVPTPVSPAPLPTRPDTPPVSNTWRTGDPESDRLMQEVQALKKRMQAEYKAAQAAPPKPKPQYYIQKHPDGTLERKVMMYSSKVGVATDAFEGLLVTPTDPLKPDTFLPNPSIEKSEPETVDDFSCYRPARKTDH